MTNDPNDRQWKYEDGTGPLGKGNRNQRESVSAYMGQSNFPQQVKDIELF